MTSTGRQVPQPVVAEHRLTTAELHQLGTTLADPAETAERTVSAELVAAGAVERVTQRAVRSQRVRERRVHVRARIPDVVRVVPGVLVRLERRIDDLHQTLGGRTATGVAVPRVDGTRVTVGLLNHPAVHRGVQAVVVLTEVSQLLHDQTTPPIGTRGRVGHERTSVRLTRHCPVHVVVVLVGSPRVVVVRPTVLQVDTGGVDQFGRGGVVVGDPEAELLHPVFTERVHRPGNVNRLTASVSPAIAGAVARRQRGIRECSPDDLPHLLPTESPGMAGRPAAESAALSSRRRRSQTTPDGLYDMVQGLRGQLLGHLHDLTGERTDTVDGLAETIGEAHEPRQRGSRRGSDLDRGVVLDEEVADLVPESTTLLEGVCVPESTDSLATEYRGPHGSHGSVTTRGPLLARGPDVLTVTQLGVDAVRGTGAASAHRTTLGEGLHAAAPGAAMAAATVELELSDGGAAPQLADPVPALDDAVVPDDVDDPLDRALDLLLQALPEPTDGVDSRTDLVPDPLDGT